MLRPARREDKELEARFGDAFVGYASRVPAFFPRLPPAPVRRAWRASVKGSPSASREGAGTEKAE